jgi:hypothetical protein
LSRTNIEKDYLEKLFGAKAFKNTFGMWLDSHDYINIALYILEDCKENDLDTIIEYYISYFSKYIRFLDKNKQLKQIKKLQKKSGQSKRKIILSKILGFYSILSNLQMGKNVYIVCENEDIDSYRTIEEEPSYTILHQACKFNIDSKHYLSLFHLKRDKYEIRQSYLNNWLYFAAFSPIWYSRIQKYRGVINHERKIITFADDDDLEIFSNKYNYEPDEQKKEIQDRSIQNIENIRTWKSFYEEHQKNCLVDIDPNYFDDLIKIEY